MFALSITNPKFKTEVNNHWTGTAQLIIDLNNGIEISVIKHGFSYGTEAALIIDGHGVVYIPSNSEYGQPSIIGEQYTWDELTEEEKEFLSPFTDVWGYIEYDELVRVAEIVSKLQRKDID
jgi:hypothetical protein